MKKKKIIMTGESGRFAKNLLKLIDHSGIINVGGQKK